MTSNKASSDSATQPSETKGSRQATSDELTHSRTKLGEPVYKVSFWTPRTSLITLILVLLLIIGKHALPYMSGVLGALTIYVLLRGQMKWLVERKHWGRSWAASLLTVEAIFFFLIPILGIVLMLIDLFSTFDPESLNVLTTQAQEMIQQVEDRFGIELWSEENLQKLTSVSTSLVKGLLQGMSSFFLNAFVILFLLYFMLRGYDHFESAVEELLPFTGKNKRTVSSETISIVKSNAIGIPVLALVQGVFAYIGYLIFGVENALLFAVLTTFTTIIPVLGTMIVWVPMAIIMGINGDWLNAILLGAYGFIVIGGVDNVARLLLQKQMANIHPLITIFGVFIGLSLFGFWGVIFGPLILSLIVLFINLYRHDYVPGSKAKPSASTDHQETKSLERLSQIVQNSGLSALNKSEQERYEKTHTDENKPEGDE
ncbi:AI-2E family transporter [Porphyromonas uenonis]|uniref:AI-2E family transporter n=1 Tax=Porphyromonas uenonis TaxID=281920 RepID=UPI0026EA0BB5|nr:AI-2E family transporter [Porphyromonas uenonis]